MPDENGDPTEDEMQETVDEGHDFLLRVIGVRGPDDPYFKPVEIEPPSGKLVALDAAVMSAHLFVAMVMFKSLPQLLEEKIKGMEKAIGKLVAAQIAGFIARQIIQVVRFVTIIADLWSEEETGRALEKRIRAASALVRKQLIEASLSQTTKRRCRRTVSSRHKTPPQRKENKSWKQKTPRNR